MRERTVTVRLDEDQAEGVEKIAQVDCVGNVHGGCPRPDTGVLALLPHTSFVPTGCSNPRVQEVVILVAKHLSNRQIASELMLSEPTLATHVRHILKKLGLHSRKEIAAYFIREQR